MQWMHICNFIAIAVFFQSYGTELQESLCRLTLTCTHPFCHQSLNKPRLSRYSESSLCSWWSLEGGRERKGRGRQETTCGSEALSIQPAKELLNRVLRARPVDCWRSAGYRGCSRCVESRVRSPGLRWEQGNLGSVWQPKAVAWFFPEVPCCCIYFFLCSSVLSVGCGRMREL